MPRQRTAHPARRLFLLVAILGAAAGLRLWGLDQAPPGFHVDEAFHLLNAQKIAQGREFPVYITGNYGNEPAFAYLAALGLKLVGPVTWAGRLAAAWAGLLGVALTIRAGKEMFPGQPAGAWAGLLLAVLYSHLHFSRYGSQPILAPLAAAGTMAALWHGARTGRPAAYALAGLCLGFGLASYLAFRLFPLAILAAGLALLATNRRGRAGLLRGGLLAGGVALLVYSPLALFFIQHPAWFFNRASMTTEATLGSAGASATLARNALATLGGLFLRGDADGRYNLPGRPALDAIQLAFFLLGLGLCLRRPRQARTWALAAWLAVGLLPSMLTEGAPQFGRTTMATPALALLMAAGVSAAWQWARPNWARGLIGLALALSALWGLRDYFVRWARDPDIFRILNGDELALAMALRSAPSGASLYAAPLQRDYYRDYQASELVFRPGEFGAYDRGFWSLEYLLGPEAYARLGAFNARECLVLPAVTTAPALYAILAEQSPGALPALQAAFPAGAVTGAGQAYADRVSVETFLVPAGQAARVELALADDSNFGGAVRLLGHTLLPGDARPGGQIQLTAAWRVEQRTDAPYKTFVHLIGPPKADGNLVYAQRDAEPCLNSYPTWQWTPGELVIDSYTLSLPGDIAPGLYTLQVGWYAALGAGERWPAFDSAGQPVGDAVILGEVQVP